MSKHKSTPRVIVVVKPMMKGRKRDDLAHTKLDLPINTKAMASDRSRHGTGPRGKEGKG